MPDVKMIFWILLFSWLMAGLVKSGKVPTIF